ncbi:response regulator [Azospirillum canadense]|uniref:response regulator n=1 Tax=Azospirillum canadense TaxID=403962 RepID=UPI002226F5A0|nr:response regulator [Azospirillum canadense]MCW2239154.1 CheY-like chemotaxis protein [Azospirillum canadense]
MTGKLLDGCRVLIVEDELLIAMVLEENLEDAGATIVGMAGSLADALALIEREAFDAAVLDARLDDEPVTAVADALAAGAIPFVFHSGYGPEHLPAQHRHRPLLRKPSDPAAVVLALRDALG